MGLLLFSVRLPNTCTFAFGSTFVCVKLSITPQLVEAFDTVNN